MLRSVYLAAVSMVLAGCAVSPGGGEKLVGLSIDEVRVSLGTPDSQSRATVPQSWVGAFGPHPASLQPGDRYISLYYSDYQGEQIHLYAVSPAVYQRVKGESPGSRSAYVLEAYKFPKGAVF